MIEYTIKKDKDDVFLCPFTDNLGDVFDFLTLLEKHNIRKLSVNIDCISTRCETGQKIWPRLAFYLLLKLVQINYKFSNNVRILHIWTYTPTFSLYQTDILKCSLEKRGGGQCQIILITRWVTWNENKNRYTKMYIDFMSTLL